MIRWTNEFSVSIEDIDREHKGLFEALNRFYDGLMRKASKENMRILIETLINYTKTHFANEERYMRQIGYPELDEHIKEHRYFMAKTEELYNKFEAGKLMVSFEVTNFIKDWITNHIMTQDKLYANFTAGK